MLIGTVATLLMLAAFGPAPAQTAVPTYPVAHHRAAAKPKPRSRTRHAPAPAGSGISDARARQIQHALVQAGYLDQASGHWDAAARAAMTRYQKDHHWQTEYTPDARALIALGLGPAVDGVPPTVTANNAASDSAPSPAPTTATDATPDNAAYGVKAGRQAGR